MGFFVGSVCIADPLPKPLERTGKVSDETHLPDTKRMQPVDCHSSPEFGSCVAFLTRWYFDTIAKRCIRFDYGGCGGNENRYLTKRQCKKACKNKGCPGNQENDGAGCSCPAGKVDDGTGSYNCVIAGCPGNQMDDGFGNCKCPFDTVELEPGTGNCVPDWGVL